MKFKKILLPFLILILLNTLIQGQKKDLLQTEDLAFLKQMVKDVMDSSRIYPNQIISDNFGPNRTGGILIRLGGRNSYPAFWIRDYAMSIQSGFVTQEEQKHMLLLTAKTQSNEFKFTKWGSFIPKGAVADHIRITAQKLASEYIQDLREGDFRKGVEFGAPWECFNGNAKQKPVYLTSVAVPFIIFRDR